MKEYHKIIIKSLKHDGSLHRKWHENYLLKQTDDLIIGYNNATKVTEVDGSVWTSEEPAVFYFHKKHYYNVIALLREDGIYFYVNLSSPFSFAKGVLSYIDYDLDLLLSPKGEIELLDEAEYRLHKKKYGYSKELVETIDSYLPYIYEQIQKEQEPFTEKFVYYWYNKATHK